MTEGEVVGDDRHALVLQLPRGVLAHRVAGLGGSAYCANEPRVRLALREVLGRSRGRDDGHLGLANVVVNRQRLERGERADDDVYAVLLHQLLCLGLGDRRLAGRVSDDQLHLAARDHVVALFKEQAQPVFHLLATGGQRAGLDGEEAKADRLCGQRGQGQRGGDEGGGEDFWQCIQDHKNCSGGKNFSLF